jgi:hypothetical protein
MTVMQMYLFLHTVTNVLPHVPLYATVIHKITWHLY